MKNRAVLSSCAGLFVCLACSAAASSMQAPSQPVHAEVDSGYLEAFWGDPPPDDPALPAILEVSLVKPDGQRLRLDAKSASAAVEDIGALNGRQVAVTHRAGPSAGSARMVDALAPIAKGGSPIPVNTSWALLGCRFPEDAGSVASTAQMLEQYGQEPWHLGDYWAQVSWGHASLLGAAEFGWTTMPHPKSWYEDSDTFAGYDLNAMAQDCHDSSAEPLALQAFDGFSMAFSSRVSTGSFSSYAFGGLACLQFAGETVCRPNMWLPPWAHLRPATIAHEMGHGHGLSHVDNSDGDADPYDNPWDVMSSTGQHAYDHPAYGLQPKYLSMQSRIKLGWVPAEAVAFVQLPLQNVVVREFHLERANASRVDGHHVLVVRMPLPEDHDGNPLPSQAPLYFVEARTVENPYDQRLPGNAVIIHRAETMNTTAKLVDSADPPSDFSNTESVMLRAGESYVLPGRTERIRVQSRTATGFWISVERY